MSNLTDNFKMKPPIKDVIWWNGKPADWSNLPRWNISTTQRFAENKLNYGQFGMLGHNGIDWGFRRGCPIVAPRRIWVTYTSTDSNGYGINIFAETERKVVDGKTYYLELVFGHLRETVAQPYKWYEQGDLIGYGNSTGFSTGDHLHFGIRPYVQISQTSSQQLNINNGYRGYVDPEPYLDTQVVWTYGELTEDNMEFFKEVGDSAIYQKGADGIYYPINSGITFNRLYGDFADHTITELPEVKPRGERLGLVI